jgi:hypothetical protein
MLCIWWRKIYGCSWPAHAFKVVKSVLTGGNYWREVATASELDVGGDDVCQCGWCVIWGVSTSMGILQVRRNVGSICAG